MIINIAYKHGLGALAANTRHVHLLLIPRAPHSEDDYDALSKR